MGEVYRAEDTRLGREVAIKVLPEGFLDDPDREARFEREARVLASFDHPNIAGVYGLEEAEGRRFLVMELVSGEGLDVRLDRGSLPWRDAVAIARQLAEALEAAHERGVAHRDLKPANVMVTPQGTVKVLDFGLAKAWEGEGTRPDLSHSPTLTGRGTGPGALLGTAAYMAPEQARALPTDRRVDIWSFGVTVYELLTGEKAFPGETASDCLAGILKDEPDWDALPDDLPPSLERLLRRCLEKDPRQRLQAIGEARILLERPLEELETEAESVPEGAAGAGAAQDAPAAPAVARWAWLAAAAALALGAVGWYRALRPGEAGQPALRLQAEALTWFGGMEVQPTLSPDGRFVAYASDADGDWDIYLLRVGGDKPINLTAGSDDDDLQPAFSPDGETLAFRSERSGGGIFVMGATGESVRRLTDFGYNPSWSPDGGRLVMATETTDQSPLSRETTSALWIVDLADGSSSRIPGEFDAVQPAWSPNGARIAYWGLPPGAGQRDVATVSLDGSDPTPVTDDPDLDWSPTWSPDGRFLYFSSDRGGSLNLWRVAIDEASGEIGGAYEPLATPSRWSGEATLARDGATMVFTSLDRRGNAEAISLDPSTGGVAGPAEQVTRGTNLFGFLDPSPEGDRLVLANSGRKEDLFIVEADGENLRRVTDDPYKDRGPRWSPDGERIVFYSDHGEGYQLWTVKPDGSALERATELPLEEQWIASPAWSPSGDELVFSYGFEAAIAGFAGEPITSARILPPPGDGDGFAVSDWAPGDRILGLSWDAGSGVYRPRVGVFDPESESYAWVEALPVESGEFIGHPTWHPDGRHAIFSSAGDVYRVDLTDGSRTVLLDAPPGVRYVQAKVSADGRSLFYLRIEEEADLWIARLEDGTGGR